jgi:chromosome partitioning protein
VETPIIAQLNQKGGVGKTTLATYIAGEFALSGSRVAVIDADPQGSALDWAQRRTQNRLPRVFGVIGLARETLHQEAPELAKTVDHVIVDGPPPHRRARALCTACGRPGAGSRAAQSV